MKSFLHTSTFHLMNIYTIHACTSSSQFCRSHCFTYNGEIELQSWRYRVTDGKMCVFCHIPCFLSLIPWFGFVTGPGVYRDAVETGLAVCFGSTSFSIPPGSFCSNFLTLLIAPQGGLYPWIIIHPCSTAPGAPKSVPAA